MKKFYDLIRVVCFVIGLILIYIIINSIFEVDDSRAYQSVKGFYEEDNSLDAVYVGASNVYAFWQAPLVWNEYGYTVYPVSVPSMPPQAIKYMIEECRKTQPDALYIVNLNMFKNANITVSRLHYVIDYIPFSLTKARMIEELADISGIKGTDKLEYYFPSIRFHSKWSELTSEDFNHSLEGMKAAVHYDNFLGKKKDVSYVYQDTNKRTAVDEEPLKVLQELLTYCKKESVNVLFVAVPQAVKDRMIIEQRNVLGDIVESEGFEYLNLNGMVEEIGLDLSTDYYDELHTNIHGSLKYTHYLGKYLSENYDFENKRNNPDYESWNESYDKYLDIIVSYALDFELNHEARDNNLLEPKLFECISYDNEIQLKWEKTEGAEGYRIYCQTSNGEDTQYNEWKCVVEVDETTTVYVDKVYDSNLIYNYTVVPIKTESDITYYGKYNMDGISVKVGTD